MKSLKQWFLVYATGSIVVILHATASAQTNHVLSTADVAVCTAEQLEEWQFVNNATLGVAGHDPAGSQVGTFPAKRTGFGKNWYPASEFKQTLCGTLDHFNFYDPWTSGDEADWNNFIIPDPTFEYLITDLLPLKKFSFNENDEDNPDNQDEWKDCEGVNDCMEAEITPDESFYGNPWFSKEDNNSVLEGETVCTYGPWVWEEAHGNRPEIHPSELYWWTEGSDGPYFLMLLQDDSNRFDRNANYFEDESATPPDFWRPWSAFPRTGEFHLAFEHRRSQDPLIFDINPLFGREVVTGEDPVASEDTDDGKRHAIEYNGRLVLLANEGQRQDEDLGVRFVDVCRNPNNTRLQGYVSLMSQVGQGDRGGEGYSVLRVDKRREAISTKRITVTIQSIGRLPEGLPSATFFVRVDDRRLSFPATGTFNRRVTLESFPSSERLNLAFTARRPGSGQLDNARASFSESNGFGAGRHRVKITGARLIPPNDPDGELVTTDLYEVVYHIDVEDDLPSTQLVKPPALKVATLQNSVLPGTLRRDTTGTEPQLVMDYMVNVLGPGRSLASVQLNASGQSHPVNFQALPAPIIAGQEQRIRIRNIPMVFKGDTFDPKKASPSLDLRMGSGEVKQLTLPAVALLPHIVSDTLISSVADSSAWGIMVEAVDGDSDLPASSIPVHSIRRQQIDVEPRYVPMRLGQPDLGDDSPIVEELNEVLQSEDEARTQELFGTSEPFKVSWSFEATEVETGDPIPVTVNGPARTGEVQVSVYPGQMPEGRIEVAFPEGVSYRLIELVATVSLTDPFGTIGSMQHRLWSHVFRWDTEDDLLAAVLSMMTSITGKSVDISNSVADLNIVSDPQSRRAHLIRLVTIQAAEDKRITVEELRRLVLSTEQLNNE